MRSVSSRTRTRRRASGAPPSARLDDVDVLAEIARTDPDEDVRAEAIRNLTGMATEARDVRAAPPRSSASLLVARPLARGRRHRPREHQPRGARRGRRSHHRSEVARLHQPSRPGRLHPAARSGPVDRCGGDHERCPEVGADRRRVAALERVDDAESLGAIAQRARNKVAARRARTRLRQIEEAARRPRAEPFALSPEDLERAGALLRRAESLVAVADPAMAATELAAVRLAWAELQADVELDAPARCSVSRRRATPRARRSPSVSASAKPKRSGRGRSRASRPIGWRSSREIESLSGERRAGSHRRAEGGAGTRCRRCRRSTRRR